MSAEGGDCLRQRIDGVVSKESRMRIPIERRPPGDYTRRALSRAAKLHDALCDQVCISLYPLGDLVEQLTQVHEVEAFDVPVGLPALQLQIDGVG
jgi:hypothetical protein